MIVTAILYIIYYLVYAIAAVTILNLSDVSAGSDVVNAVTTVTHYLATWNSFLPITTLLAVLFAITAIELIVALYKIIMWVIRRFPTQS